VRPIREIRTSAITQTVSQLCQEANFSLGDDVLQALREAKKEEESPLGSQVIDQLLKNAELCQRERLPLCQDCGSAIVFLEMGQDVHISGGGLHEAVQEGVHQGYKQGYLRKSMVSQPFSARLNTKDNTPAIIHADIVPGDRLKITVMPKGGGSENVSRLFMLTPAQGRQGIIDAVVQAVDEAGSSPCPPIIVGVGIGGSAEKAMMMAKKCLLRKVNETNPDPEVAELEKELLRRINALGIGPQGFGGRITALAVHIETFPTHMTSLPVTISFQCNAARHKEAVL